jgi:hypothetical protein
MANPDRFREQLLLSVGDEGLEELTLRLVERDYPAAHRTGRGRDGGIDVLSDHERPPAHAWQAKFYPHDDVSWAKCRESLAKAMGREHPPRRYTFVFPRRLRAKERNHWAGAFLPAARRDYPKLESIDYWDDLPRRIEERGDLVDALTGGALGLYAARLFASTQAQSAPAQSPLLDGGLAARISALGSIDKEFRYTLSAGENDSERTPSDRALHFSFERLPASQPRFALSLQTENGWERLTAHLRDTSGGYEPQLWFADTEEGTAALTRARMTLAKGHEVTLSGEAVGVRGVEIPAGLAALGANDDLLRNGTLRIGLTEPLELTVALQLQAAAAPTQNTLKLYRVPPLPGSVDAYAGSFFGAVVTIDLEPVTETEPEEMMLNFGLSLAVEGEDPARVLAGLGFSWAVARAEVIELRCDGLLPAEGLRAAGAAPPDAQSDETWHHAAVLAGALAALNRHDGFARLMPASVSESDVNLAQMVLALFQPDGLFIGVPPGDNEFRPFCLGTPTR